MDSSLPVVQVKESHALMLDPNMAPSGNTFTLAVAAYPRMTRGDRISLIWQGYFDDGSKDESYTNNRTLENTDVGNVLTWRLESGYVGFIEGGHAQLSYQLEYADAQGGAADSESETFAIVRPTSTRLPMPGIENHSGGTIDPDDFPLGLVVIIKAYPGIEPGDYVVLYALGAPGSASAIRSLRVDQGMINRGELSFSLDHSWLRDRLGETITVEYQYARPRNAESSAVLTLEVRAAWHPAAPIVRDALPEAIDPLPNQGYINADGLRDGAMVSIPADVELKPDDRVEVHWVGHGTSGSYIAVQAEPGDSHKFAIPASAVPANMGKRLEVFYKVMRPGEADATSTAFDLRVVPLLKERFRTIESECVSAGKLLLSCVSSPGLKLTLKQWMFMAAGQQLTIRVESSASEYVVENLPIEPRHVAAGEVTARLRREFLASLNIGASLTFKVFVSFDDGASLIEFPGLSVVLAT